MGEVDLAEQYRLEGNEHFRSSRYHNAIRCYEKSLECRETSAVLANRAQAYLNTKQYERALMDSAKALELDGANRKALFRHAKALANLHLFEVAAEKLLKDEQSDPSNKEFARLIESVKGKANCAELRISCGERNEFLRSKLPLKDIENIEVVRTRSEEEQSEGKLKLKSSQIEIPPPSTTSFKFIADFQALKSRPEAFANYFMAIDGEKYAELLGEVIETEMIEVLIMGFDTLANQSNIAQILKCLIHLAGVPRFDVAVTFLDVRLKDGLGTHITAVCLALYFTERLNSYGNLEVVLHEWNSVTLASDILQTRFDLSECLSVESIDKTICCG